MPEHNLAEINESLMLVLVRQHELTELAETLNAQLEAEILARRKAEVALVNAEKLVSVGRMATVLAHEINNPLDAVMNVLYLAQTAEGLPEAVHQYLNMADSELKRIAHITRQTLGFYRESSGLTTFQVCLLIDSVIEVLKAKRISKQAMVEKQCEESLELTAFQGELRQVLSNFVMNSLDAITEGGRIVIKGSLSSNPISGCRRIRITVSDNGRGMSPSVLHQVFDPFFTTKGSVGNGLGLWVSSQIIEKHRGSVRARSSTFGRCQGTTFSMVLPLEQGSTGEGLSDIGHS